MDTEGIGREMEMVVEIEKIGKDMREMGIEIEKEGIEIATRETVETVTERIEAWETVRQETTTTTITREIGMIEMVIEIGTGREIAIVETIVTEISHMTTATDHMTGHVMIGPIDHQIVRGLETGKIRVHMEHLAHLAQVRAINHRAMHHISLHHIP
jgi:hypothetical protein